MILDAGEGTLGSLRRRFGEEYAARVVSQYLPHISPIYPIYLPISPLYLRYISAAASARRAPRAW